MAKRRRSAGVMKADNAHLSDNVEYLSEILLHALEDGKVGKIADLAHRQR